MLETPKALSTLKVIPSENIKDIIMDNQQETKRYLFVWRSARCHIERVARSCRIRL